MARNTYCPHCNVVNYCRDQPWCSRRLQQMQCDDHEMFAGGLEKENAELRATIVKLVAAVQRFLDLDGSCDYTDEQLPPEQCPGIAEVGGMCHWCQLRAALADAAAREEE